MLHFREGGLGFQAIRFRVHLTNKSIPDALQKKCVAQ